MNRRQLRHVRQPRFLPVGGVTTRKYLRRGSGRFQVVCHAPKLLARQIPPWNSCSMLAVDDPFGDLAVVERTPPTLFIRGHQRLDPFSLLIGKQQECDFVSPEGYDLPAHHPVRGDSLAVQPLCDAVQLSTQLTPRQAQIDCAGTDSVALESHVEVRLRWRIGACI